MSSECLGLCGAWLGVGTESWSFRLFFVFEGVLVEEGVDDHGPGEVFVAVFSEGGETLLEGGEGVRRRQLGGDRFMETGEFFILRSGFGEELLGLVGGGLEILRFVHEHKGLQGGVSTLASGDAGIAAGGVEDRHLRGRKAAFPEGINAPATGIGAGGGVEFIREGAGEGDHFPESVGLGRFDAAAAHFVVEEFGDGEELVANHF